MLRKLQGRSQREVATRLGLSERTVEPVRREETNALGFLLTAGVLANF